MLPLPKNDRETYLQIREVARRFAEGVVRPAAEELDRDERFPIEIYRRMGELGLFGLTVPAECGGVGLETVISRWMRTTMVRTAPSLPWRIAAAS